MGKCTQSLVHFVLRRLVSPRLPLRRHHVSTALGAAGSRIPCFSMGICLPAMCPAVIYCFACGQKKKKAGIPSLPCCAQFHCYSSIHSGEGNGNALPCSCLENPMDGGAWWAAVHEVAKSWTRLSDFTFTFHFHALEKEMAAHSKCSCLENPRDGGAWWAAIYGVAQSRTRLR